SQDPVRSGNPYSYAAGDPVDFSDPTGAFAFHDLAKILSTNVAEFRTGLLKAQCALSAAGGLIELGLNYATTEKFSLDGALSILIGVTASCKFAGYGLPAKSGWNLIGFPLISGVLAAIGDLVGQLDCLQQGNGLSLDHLRNSAFSAALIGLGAAILGLRLPESITARSFLAVLGVTLASGGAAGIVDFNNTGGPSC
ncbi:MAG TPA: hypothetical protein VHO95_01870, partial [Candidatus Dormibacteraeota bacterium]|nr:hypothetical protein [Candidatus Dormibacteraeota bacterium]